MDDSEISFERATFTSFEEAMGPKGGCGGCWCMLWRLPKKSFDAGQGETNKQAMKALFEAGEIFGMVAKHDGIVVGWVQIGPRSEFTRLENSRVLKPVDEREVWSVSCFIIDKAYRRSGLSTKLLLAACDLATAEGAQCLEGYPIETSKEKYPPVYAWTGFAKTFVRAGFEEVARRSETRPIFRKALV